jgi:hypothetical protein
VREQFARGAQGLLLENSRQEKQAEFNDSSGFAGSNASKKCLAVKFGKGASKN